MIRVHVRMKGKMHKTVRDLQWSKVSRHIPVMQRKRKQVKMAEGKIEVFFGSAMEGYRVRNQEGSEGQRVLILMEG